MDSLELRHFVAVAEELHFGRAAERLGLAQPALSRSVAKLERRLGVILLERTSRSVALTAAGRVLLDEGRALLGALTAAERHTQAAARAPAELVLATKAGSSEEALVKLLHSYRARPDAVVVRLLLCDAQQQRDLVLDGQADAALLHLPYDSTTGLDIEEIGTEGQVALLPRTRELAAQQRLRTTDLADLPGLPMVDWVSPSQPASHRLSGTRTTATGPAVHNLTQVFQLVSLEQAVALLPETACLGLRENLVAVPEVDAPLVRTVIGWSPNNRSSTLASLITAVGGS